MDVDRLIPQSAHDYRGHGTDSADLYGSLAEDRYSGIPGGPPAASTASTASRSAGKDRQSHPDRHRQWPAADAHQDSTKSSDDQRRGSPTAGNGFGGRS